MTPSVRFARQRVTPMQGVPNRTPRAFARFRASLVRDAIKCRSNSASPPTTVRISRPCGVVVSAQASRSERKLAFASPIVAKILRSSRVDRSKPVQPRHKHDVAFVKLGQKPLELLAIATRSVDLLLKNPLRARRLQLRNLRAQALPKSTPSHPHKPSS